MLDQLAEADPPSVRTDGHWGEKTYHFLLPSLVLSHTDVFVVLGFTLELVCHQQHRQVLIDAAQPTAVYLDKLQGRGLEELLEHHPVVTLNRKQLAD